MFRYFLLIFLLILLLIGFIVVKDNTYDMAPGNMDYEVDDLIG